MIVGLQGSVVPTPSEAEKNAARVNTNYEHRYIFSLSIPVRELDRVINSIFSCAPPNPLAGTDCRSSWPVGK